MEHKVVNSLLMGSGHISYNALSSHEKKKLQARILIPKGLCVQGLGQIKLSLGEILLKANGFLLFLNAFVLEEIFH